MVTVTFDVIMLIHERRVVCRWWYGGVLSHRGSGDEGSLIEIGRLVRRFFGRRLFNQL